jgi:hypothetical protein
MLKAGSSMAIVSVIFFIFWGSSLCSCAVPLALLFGGVTGYFTGQWETPADKQQAVTHGAIAGLIAGTGAAAGGMFSQIVWGWIGKPEGLASFLGLSNGNAALTPYSGLVSIGLLGIGVCSGAFLAVLMSAAGALGGWLHFRKITKTVGPSV